MHSEIKFRLKVKKYVYVIVEIKITLQDIHSGD